MESLKCLIFLMAICLQFRSIHCMDCFACQNIDDPHSCNSTISCHDSQVCYMNVQGGIYNMGCADNQHCGGISSVGIVGRDVTSRQTSSCLECCSTDHCNSDLCKHQKPTSCIDDESVDCARMNTIFHVCKDVQQAKLVCPKFCGLCKLVDGQWSDWSTWSNCDVTCDQGIQIKTRTCSNPAPANGGLDCIGNSTETKQCNKDPCPVHGKWSSWESWGSCSVSCDVGMQRRDRTCSNPYPSRNGDHCFGTPLEDRLCFPGACADGAWSTWGSWDSCDGGLQSRLRTCSNPRPSQMGRYCDGKSEQTRICNNQTDGAWSSWGSWDSCDGGLQSRLRTCSNPRPSQMGRYCEGKSEQTRLCNNQTDGAWSDWGSWDSCSESCGGGLQSRLRTCSSPRPSLLGRYCDGRSEQTQQCNKNRCTDGAWSNWGSWDSCSESCGGGLQSRLRTCSSPRPSLLGRYCDGRSEQTQQCNKHGCTEVNVAFTAYNIYQNSSSYSILLFRSTYINNGNAYDASTGKFTCTIPGVYYFSVTLTKQYKELTSVYAYLRINGVNKLGMYWNSYEEEKYMIEETPLIQSGTFHLMKNDVVDIYGKSNQFYGGYDSTFTGYLITPD